MLILPLVKGTTPLATSSIVSVALVAASAVLTSVTSVVVVVVVILVIVPASTTIVLPILVRVGLLLLVTTITRGV